MKRNEPQWKRDLANYSIREAKQAVWNSLYGIKNKPRFNWEPKISKYAKYIDTIGSDSFIHTYINGEWKASE